MTGLGLRPAVLGPDVRSLRQASGIDRRAGPVCRSGAALPVSPAASRRCSHGASCMAWRQPASVVTRSVIRDLYSGRQMARVMSLTFMVFLMVPVLAPSLGQFILLAGALALHFRRVRRVCRIRLRRGPGCACPRPCTRVSPDA